MHALFRLSSSKRLYCGCYFGPYGEIEQQSIGLLGKNKKKFSTNVCVSPKFNLSKARRFEVVMNPLEELFFFSFSFYP